MSKKAVILLSGGQDSTTCLALAKKQGFNCYALTFNFGQKHYTEIEAAKVIAKHFSVTEHKILTLPINEFGGSALTDPSIQVQNHKGDNKIPSTYVPARNTVFLAMAMSWAEALGSNDIFIGANHVDYSGYPDCRPEYYKAFTHMANLATKAGVEGQKLTIHTPLLQMSKAEIVKLGAELGIDYRMTVSCYRLDVEARACGSCDACVLRKKGFQEAGAKDPTRYV